MPTSPTAIFSEEKRAELPVLKDRLIRSVLLHFAPLYDAFPDTAFLMEYRRRSLLIGRDVRVYDALTDREKAKGGTPAHVLDVTDTGELLVLYEDGRREALSSGEVTLGI
jgi:BirA family biotin operon repressor/biotin-[acetyl-CoA-carboxylase] ligase